MDHAPSFEPTICPVCLGREADSFFRHQHYHFVRCSDCGTIYLDPLPDAEKVRELYSDAYDGATTGYFVKVEKKLRRSRRRIRALSRYRRAGRFLDVGCNGGFMVEAAREAGFAGVGIDLDQAAIAFARQHYPGNTFFNGTVEEFACVNERAFDLIYASEVIEHVPDARSFCAAVAGLLRPGGILFLTTPDIGHWRRPRDLSKWDGFCPPSHCVYFTPASLARLLAANGIAVVRRRFAFKPGIKLVCRKL